MRNYMVSCLNYHQDSPDFMAKSKIYLKNTETRSRICNCKSYKK